MLLLPLQVLSEAERERSRASSAEEVLAQRDAQLQQAQQQAQQLQEQTSRLSTALESSQKMAEKVCSTCIAGPACMDQGCYNHCGSICNMYQYSCIRCLLCSPPAS